DESKNFIEYRYNVTRYNLTNVDTVSAVDKNMGYNGALTLDRAIYNGNAQTPNIDIWASSDKKLVLGVDYTIAPVGDNINAGTYKMAVTLIGNYEGVVEVEGFTINPVNMATAYDGGNIAVDYVMSYPYDHGNPVELQGLKITFNGGLLTLGKDYNIAYEGGAAAPSQTGNHSAKVSGIGNFSGYLLDGDKDVVNYYIGASVALPDSIASIIYGNNASAGFDLNVSSLAPEAKLDGDLTVNILKITAYQGDTAVATLVSDTNTFVWIVGQGREPRAMRFLSTAGLNVGSYRIVVEYNATLAGADTVNGITETNLTVVRSSDFNFRLTVNAVTSSTVKINLASNMYRNYEYSLDGVEWFELPSDGVISGLTDMKDYNIKVRIHDSNFAEESLEEANWVSISAKTTLAPNKVTDVARRLKSGFKASSVKDYLKMLDNDKLVASAEKTADYNTAIADATNAFNAYLTKVNNAIASANSTANKMASKSSSGEGGAVAAGTAASVGAISLALAGIMFVRRKKNEGGDKPKGRVSMTAKKNIGKRAVKLAVIVAICIISVLTVCLTGCKEVYNEQNIFLAADNVIINGAKADISYTISEGSTVVYS
ncbi:MAG: hypothetical protein K2I79_04345, partial [Clostridia bacterium]|nr:hypothetical protein [Clostridia bacterium]